MLDARDVDGEIELTRELTAERTGVAPAGGAAGRLVVVMVRDIAVIDRRCG
jgi:hypothetical protein